MNEEKLSIAVVEARRFLRRVKALREEMANPQPGTWRALRLKEDDKVYLSDVPKQSGAVRRASLDLTRALADLRRP